MGGFRADVTDGRAAGCSGEPAVGNQSHVLIQPHARNGRRGVQHLPHSRTALGTLVADDYHIPGFDFPGVNGGNGILFAVEHPGRPAVDHHFLCHRGPLHHTALRRQIALQHRDAAVLTVRVLDGPNQLRVTVYYALQIFAQGPAGTGQHAGVQKPFLRQLLHDRVHAPGLLQVLHIRLACRGQMAEIGSPAGNLVGHIQVKLDAALVGDSRQVQHGIRGTAQGLSLIHSMLVNGHVGTATRIQPRRIENIAAILGLIPGIGKKHVGQFIAGVFQHMPHVALALVVEEAVRGGVDVAQILGTEGFDDIAGLVVQLTEVVGMGLDFHPEALPLNDGQQFLHGPEEHPVANLLLIGVAGKLGVNNRHAHIHGNLNDALPVGYGVLALFLGGAGPAVDHDEGGNFHAGFLQSLPVLLFALLGKQGMLVERIDAGMGGLFNVLVAPAGHLADIIADRHLFGKNVHVECDFHARFLHSFM